ncbi:MULTISPECIES: EthD domain-containing protein [unclassified Rhizobium]|uniref:EthD domain-containing protein n=1 Tax=unclassified Rhizobium TaxID=2613769 RepID=UPI00160A7CE4|nr:MULTISPECIES: EthD domain-containing protein [unclassified Rhizobium]MBB3386182.1 uncharacterized protein (TIGR02118 family) [Rhizobium sp. BK098]MBB3571158.1 uncharacterized protein (TIGR02118 family) [Rhizobium sp. BK491]MBB3617886.1 uncharacterized protein (TIGR02118 family) [Rhizobium sp. BK609]MBB3683661.1 uncharacterized protein (TIGR02118 family) [Rhizobium sp. BK612]
MIVRMGLFRRKPELSVQEFKSYWRGKHGTLVKNSLKTLEAYVQNIITDRSQKGIDYDRGSLELDGMSQLFFPTLAAMRRSIDTDTLQKLMADEDNFLKDLIVVTALQNTILPVERSANRVKRMSLLKRRSGITAEEFQDQWFNHHTPLVKRLPGLLGYRQNLVIDWQADRFSDATISDAIGLDGIVELWFEDEASIEHAFQSAQGRTAMMHAKEFIGEISTFVVEPFEIIPEREISRHKAA